MGALKNSKKTSLLAVAILFLFTFFNLILDAPRTHCTENSIYVFPEMKLRGLILNSYIHASVIYIYYQADRSAYLAAAK